MSYLRGPLTQGQLQKLMDDDPNYDAQAVAASSRPSRPAAEKAEAPEPAVDGRQLVPGDIEQRFVEVRDRIGEGERLVYRASLLGEGRLHYVKSTYKVDSWQERTLLSAIKGGEMPDEVWEQAEALEEPLEIVRNPEPGAEFAAICSDLQKKKNYTTWKKEFKEFLYRKQPMTMWRCKDLKQYSESGETEGDFKVRLEQLASEKRDEAIDKLRDKFGSKFDTLRTRIRKAEDKVDVEKAQYQQSRVSSVLSVGTTLMGALLGRKAFGVTNARRAGSSMRSFGRASKEKDDIGRAEENLEELQTKYEDMEADFDEQVEELNEKLSVENLEFEELVVTPRKSDIDIEDFSICWLPWRIDSSGIAEPAW